jgi:hypothetical protein
VDAVLVDRLAGVTAEGRIREDAVMRTVRGVLLALAVVTFVESRANAAPAPVPKPMRRETREARFLRLKHRLTTLGVTHSELMWDERAGRWVFVFWLPREDRNTRLFVTTSTDRDRLEAIRKAVFMIEEGASARELP